MALHEQSIGKTDEWYTPPHVFEAMGERFDIDVSSPGRDIVPWVPATLHITGNSLRHGWAGFVWMNPPFGGRGALTPWLEKFFAHGDGVALVPDRTSAPWWQAFAPKADAILFVAPKLKFIGANGEPGRSPAQGTTLMAAGPRGVAALRTAALNGLGLMLLTRRDPEPSDAAVLAANGGLTPREARDEQPSNSQAVMPLTAQAEQQ